MEFVAPKWELYLECLFRQEVVFLCSMDLAWFSILLLLAEVAGTVGGFGSSMLVMPLAGEFLPFEQALGLTAVFHVLSNGAKMVLFRKGLSRELLLSLGVPAVLGVLIGARLTIYLNEHVLMIMLGVLLVILSAGSLYAPQLKVRPTRSNAVIGGGVSGFVAGLVGTGGAIRGVTLAAFGLEKNAFVATSAWIDMGVDLSRSVVYTAQGYMSAQVWLYLPALAVISVAGTWIGRRILGTLAEHQFRQIVLLLVFGVGVFLLAKELG